MFVVFVFVEDEEEDDDEDKDDIVEEVEEEKIVPFNVCCMCSEFVTQSCQARSGISHAACGGA